MIISLRGTNGAGKSTIVRTLMSEYSYRHELRWPNRRKPAGYFCYLEGLRPLFIPGHYEIANGGVDTLKDLDTAYDLIRDHWKQNHVVYEGKNMSDGVHRLIKFPKEHVQIIGIDHPVSKCIEAVRSRGHTIKESTIERLAEKTAKDLRAFKALGFEVAILNREDALEYCRHLLKGES